MSHSTLLLIFLTEVCKDGGTKHLFVHLWSKGVGRAPVLLRSICSDCSRVWVCMLTGGVARAHLLGSFGVEEKCGRLV